MSNYSYMPWIARKIAFIWKVCVSLSCETISNRILDKKLTSSFGIENFTRMMSRRYWRYINFIVKNQSTFCPSLKTTNAYVLKK